jgi:hypothetical protein
MPFPWSKKSIRVSPVSEPQQPKTEVTQIVVLPTLDDKISSIEHKNGEQVADARKEDNEDDEVKGHLQEG